MSKRLGAILFIAMLGWGVSDWLLEPDHSAWPLNSHEIVGLIGLICRQTVTWFSRSPFSGSQELKGL